MESLLAERTRKILLNLKDLTLEEQRQILKLVLSVVRMEDE